VTVPSREPRPRRFAPLRRLWYEWRPVSLVVFEDVTLSFGERDIVRDLSLRIADKDRIGLVGPNGSGKTTLLKMLAGQQAYDKGLITRANGVSVGYLPQDIAVAGGKQLLDFVVSSVPGRTELDGKLAEAEADMARLQAEGDDASDQVMEVAQRIADLHERIDHFEQFFSDHQASRILAGLGFPTSDLTRDIGEFSGGWKMRAVLASLLFQQPDLLLMDEPTNHLDMPSVAWLTGFLKRYPRAFILISHDREFLNEQIDRVVSFETEGVRQYSGDYDRYVKQRAEEEVLLENKAKNLAREREHMEKFVERFRYKASKAAAVQSRVKMLEKMDDVELYQKRRVMRISFPPVERAVAQVIKVEGLGKSYGDLEVFRGLDIVVERGQKIGIIGANGAGKTTLLKIIAGELEATAGQVNIGNKVKVGYYAQHHADTLHPESTVYSEVQSVNPSVGPQRVRSILGAFLFSGDDVEKPVSVLSGGERARVALARLLVDPGNLLLMDEPSNHLDLQSSEALAESLSEFEGTLVFVSHNRSLIRTLATQIWNIEDGVLEIYPGTLDEYMHSCRLRLEQAAANGDAAEVSRAMPTALDTSGDALPPSQQQVPAGETREEKKARKRREAELRKQRTKVVGPKKKRVEELEDRIAKLEAEQSERNALLSDDAVYADEARRNELLSEYQKADAKLEELTARWEAAGEELEAAEAELARLEAE